MPPRGPSLPWPSPSADHTSVALPSPALVVGQGQGLGAAGNLHRAPPAAFFSRDGAATVGMEPISAPEGEAERWLAPPTLDPARARGYSIDAFATGASRDVASSASGTSRPAGADTVLAGSAHGFEVGGGGGGSGGGGGGDNGNSTGNSARRDFGAVTLPAAAWTRDRSNSLASPVLDHVSGGDGGGGGTASGSMSVEVAEELPGPARADRPSPLALMGGSFDLAGPKSRHRPLAKDGGIAGLYDYAAGSGNGGSSTRGHGGTDASSRASTLTVPTHAPSSTS